MIGYFNRYIQKYWAPKKTKVYTELGFSLILVVVLIFFAIKPTILEIFELRRMISEGKKVNMVLDERIASLNLARANYEKVEDRLDLIETALPENPLVLDFLNRVDALAAKYEVSLSTLQNRAESEDTKGESMIGVSDVGFAVSGKAKYENFFDFLTNLENLPRPVRVTFLKLTKSEGEELDFNLQGETYYLAISN